VEQGVKLRFAIVVVGILVFAAATTVVVRTHPLCGNIPNGERPSQTGSLRAVQFTRDCGATTQFSTHVSILARGATLPNEAGAVFSADETHELYLDWNGDRELVISYPRGLRTFHKSSRWNDVAIRYKEIP
jgi:hypothetical protein